MKLTPRYFLRLLGSSSVRPDRTQDVLSDHSVHIERHIHDTGDSEQQLLMSLAWSSNIH